ncbi:hypothetical protein FWF74_00455 [Candidatus Saccharibacteria bacterium]|nr:hypothetical protein [Candidatus Saccharibacteria bacterium]MCL1963318.1 hypothetical protein [Candidatus Saccharibacteria bacterium]
MSDARATQHAFSGEFRRSQNWIGGTRPDNARFVPPPVDEMNRALNDLENFIRVWCENWESDSMESTSRTVG